VSAFLSGHALLDRSRSSAATAFDSLMHAAREREIYALSSPPSGTLSRTFLPAGTDANNCAATSRQIAPAIRAALTNPCAIRENCRREPGSRPHVRCAPAAARPENVTSAEIAWSRDGAYRQTPDAFRRRYSTWSESFTDGMAISLQSP
jgi:hypothetical protein